MSAGRAVKWLQSEYFRFSTKSQPSEAVVIWKGGARERADDVLLFHRNKRMSEQSGLCSDVVRLKGLEPTRIAAREPKDDVTTVTVLKCSHCCTN